MTTTWVVVYVIAAVLAATLGLWLRFNADSVAIRNLRRNLRIITAQLDAFDDGDKAIAGELARLDSAWYTQALSRTTRDTYNWAYSIVPTAGTRERLEAARALALYRSIRDELIRLNTNRLASGLSSYRAHLEMYRFWKKYRLAAPPEAAELNITPAQLIARCNRLLAEHINFLLGSNQPEDFRELYKLLVTNRDELDSVREVEVPHPDKWLEIVAANIDHPTVKDFSLIDVSSYDGNAYPVHDQSALRGYVIRALAENDRMAAKVAVAYATSPWYTSANIGGTTSLLWLQAIASSGRPPDLHKQRDVLLMDIP